MNGAFLLVTLAAGCSFPHGALDSTDDSGHGDAPRDKDALTSVPDAQPDGTPAPATTIFTSDGNTLAVFEMNGSLADTSGNNRDATSIGGSFVDTSWGMGYMLPGQTTQGFQWNAYASLLVHPYTVEIVVTPQDTSCWKKMFGPADGGDAGWYYCGSFQSYPNATFGPNFTAKQRHYIAIVSQSSTSIRVYVNGTSIGTSNNFSMPPGSAIFFRDDTNTQRSEEVLGIVDAVRLSSVARTATEITAVQQRLLTQP